MLKIFQQLPDPSSFCVFCRYSQRGSNQCRSVDVGRKTNSSIFSFAVVSTVRSDMLRLLRVPDRGKSLPPSTPLPPVFHLTFLISSVMYYHCASLRPICLSLSSSQALSTSLSKYFQLVHVSPVSLVCLLASFSLYPLLSLSLGYLPCHYSCSHYGLLFLLSLSSTKAPGCHVCLLCSKSPLSPTLSSIIILFFDTMLEGKKKQSSHISRRKKSFQCANESRPLTNCTHVGSCSISQGPGVYRLNVLPICNPKHRF